MKNDLLLELLGETHNGLFYKASSSFVFVWKNQMVAHFLEK